MRLITIFFAIIITSTTSFASPKQTVTLTAVGDVLLGRNIAKYISKYGNNYPFEKVKKVLSGSDLTLCNLECVLSDRGTPQNRKVLLKATPNTAGILKTAGIDVASLANNHSSDFGLDAFIDTIKAVESVGILPIGDSSEVKVIRKNGLRVGFLAYMDLNISDPEKQYANKVSDATIASQVKTAKSKCDVLIISIHWGIEYTKQPTARQKDLAKLCIDSGADLIFGHHPHVIQPVETYKNRPIIYSSGSFLWDPIIPGSEKSAVYVFKLNKNNVILNKVIPVTTKKCRPVSE